MNVLSTFDGISCARVALGKAGIPITKYYASEIGAFPISISKYRYDDTVHLGDISKIRITGKTRIDFLIGGSPCQGFSNAGLGLNFDDPRSRLFFQYLRILRDLRSHNPSLIFLLENVKMIKAWADIISDYLGVEPIMINSNLVSAQSRKRLYWTNIKGITQPEDRGIVLRDILETDGVGHVRDGENWNQRDQAQCLDANYFKGADCHQQRTMVINYLDNGNIRPHRDDKRKSGVSEFGTITHPDNKGQTVIAQQRQFTHYLTDEQLEYARINHQRKTFSSGNSQGNMKFPTDVNGKGKTLTAMNIPGNRAVNHVFDKSQIRMLTPVECERLQGLPDDYTRYGIQKSKKTGLMETVKISNTQRYHALGNGFQVDTIAHILSFLK